MCFSKVKLTRIVIEGREFTANFIQRFRELLIVRIGEYIINPAALKQILLNAKTQVVNRIGRILSSVRLPNFLDEEAEREIQLVRGKLKYFRLE